MPRFDRIGSDTELEQMLSKYRTGWISVSECDIDQQNRLGHFMRIGDVFVSSTEVMRIWLSRDGLPPVVVRRHEQSSPKAAEKDTPFWDSETRTLTFNGEIVKQFLTQKAMSQCAVFSSFQEENWPRSILNPTTSKISEITRSLNTNHRTTGNIWFGGNGTGEWIVWHIGAIANSNMRKCAANKSSDSGVAKRKK